MGADRFLDHVSPSSSPPVRLCLLQRKNKKRYVYFERSLSLAHQDLLGGIPKATSAYPMIAQFLLAQNRLMARHVRATSPMRKITSGSEVPGSVHGSAWKIRVRKTSCFSSLLLFRFRCGINIVYTKTNSWYISISRGVIPEFPIRS